MREASARRVLSALLRLYPAGFRWRLGDDLVDTAMHRWREARAGSAFVSELRFWLREGVQFAFGGVLERARALGAVSAVARSALRRVARAPLQQALAVGTLALGIGATATIFTVADAVVFRPLPYADAEALYLIHTRFGGLEVSSNSLPNLRDLQATVRSMSWLAGAEDRSPALTDGVTLPERISALDVTAEYLPGVGARVQLGRSFDEDDFAGGAERVAVVSNALWRGRWGGAPSVIGSTVRLDGVPYTVVGVMHGSFRDPGPIESGAVTGAWVAVRVGDVADRHRDSYGFRLLGRLADGVSVDAARRELSAAAAGLADAYPDANRYGDDAIDFVLHPLREKTVGDARARLLLLLGAVLLLLLLSCANAANLFLARGITRAPELAVCSALGASRTRLVGQLFIENAITAGIAGVAGVLLASAGLRIFLATAPGGVLAAGGLPRLHEVALDARAMLFVVLLTAVAALLFGTVPALRGPRVAVAATASARATGSRRLRRLQASLVAAEVAIALVLVAGSGLLLNSVGNMLRVDSGFDGDDVMVVDVRPPVPRTTHAQELLFYRALMQEATSLPGVERAALMHTAPGIVGGAWSRVTAERDGGASRGGQRSTAPWTGDAPSDEMLRLNPIDGDVFDVLGMRLLAGRALEGEADGDPLVVVLNEAAARRLFPGMDRPIGHRIALGRPDQQSPWREVVGIVGDVRQRGPSRDADPQIYLPYGQRDINRLSLVLETAPGVTITGASIRQLVRDVAADLPVDRIDNLADRYAATAAPSRFLAFLLSVFAGLGLLLAMVGTYATASHALSQRVRELGIRVALGARAGGIFGLVLGRALLVASVGLAAGLVSSLVLARFLEAYVFGITARDPVTLMSAVTVIASCVLLASLAPALRAARVDPNEVLRAE